MIALLVVRHPYSGMVTLRRHRNCLVIVIIIINEVVRQFLMLLSKTSENRFHYSMMLERCACFVDKDVGREVLVETKSPTTPSNNNSINHSPDIISNSLEDAKLPETNSTTRLIILFILMVIIIGI